MRKTSEMQYPREAASVVIKHVAPMQELQNIPLQRRRARRRLELELAVPTHVNDVPLTVSGPLVVPTRPGFELMTRTRYPLPTGVPAGVGV